MVATLGRSVYAKFGGYYPEGLKVKVVCIDMINDRIRIKMANRNMPIRMSFKSKDLIIDVKWIQIN
jgi:hypothetical protein